MVKLKLVKINIENEPNFSFKSWKKNVCFSFFFYVKKSLESFEILSDFNYSNGSWGFKLFAKMLHQSGFYRKIDFHDFVHIVIYKALLFLYIFFLSFPHPKIHSMKKASVLIYLLTHTLTHICTYIKMSINARQP